MPTPREKHDRTLTNAEKQARHRQKRETEADRLRGLLYQLERAVWQAADQGNELADMVKASSIEAMIENLTRHFAETGREREG